MNLSMWRDRKILIAAAVSLFLTLMAICWPVSALRTQVGPFILRYDTVSGVALTGGWGTLSIIFLTEAAILAVGWVLASEFYSKARFISYLLIAGELASAIFFLVFSMLLVRFN
ncbi:MAG: hypothetical protein M1312_01465 [Patescibacteria group bacterium]|nr:hypothetical protein [Patescibacteria group bacterium]MDE2144942.1 hypothetical protein [Patescibacteria group bacterium]